MADKFLSFMWSKDGLFLQWRHISFFKQLSTYLHCHERMNNCIFSTRSTEMGARHAWDIKLLNKRTTNITAVHTGMPSEQDITKFNHPLLLSSSYFSHTLTCSVLIFRVVEQEYILWLDERENACKSASHFGGNKNLWKVACHINHY